MQSYIRTSRARAFPRALAFAGLAFAALAGCGKPLGQFIWVEDYAPPVMEDYQILPGDLLQVRVYKEEQISGRVRVRSDGKVSLPLINDVAAAGRTPAQFARDLEGKLKSLVNTPSVTVSVEETRPKQFSVIGEVARPGTYALEPGLSVIQALANAGGINEYAVRDRIFVLRRGLDNARVRFSYEALVHGDGKAASFTLQPGDVIVVE